jgi:hypothetical protein
MTSSTPWADEAPGAGPFCQTHLGRGGHRVAEHGPGPQLLPAAEPLPQPLPHRRRPHRRVTPGPDRSAEPGRVGDLRVSCGDAVMAPAIRLAVSWSPGAAMAGKVRAAPRSVSAAVLVAKPPARSGGRRVPSARAGSSSW